MDRFDELRRAVEQTVNHAIEQEVDAYIFAGDLTDPDSGSRVFRCVETAIFAASKLKEAGIPSLWVAGNHDVIEDGRGGTTLAPLFGIENGIIRVAECPQLVTFLGLPSIVALPFTASCRAYDAAAKARELLEEHGDIAGIVVGHLSVPGVIPGEETTEMPRGRDVLFPIEEVRGRELLLINGHYHRRQRTADGIWIPGSLARLTFGEEDHTPGYLVLGENDA